MKPEAEAGITATIQGLKDALNTEHNTDLKNTVLPDGVVMVQYV